MSEDAPRLGLSAQEMWQWAQAISLLRDGIARVRDRAGRLAFSSAEHAARADDARELPAIRSMTNDESERWLAALEASSGDSDLFAATPNEPFRFLSAPMPTTDKQGVLDEYGVWASTRDRRGALTGVARVVCQDREDVLQLERYLRAHPTADEVSRLHTIATTAAPGALTGEQRVGMARRPHADNVGEADAVVAPGRPRLTMSAWKLALRSELSAPLAGQVIVSDPAHRHFGAWRELYTRAAYEVEHGGADPAALARIIRDIPQWTDKVRNVPALAYWAIEQARAYPEYDRLVGSSSRRPSAVLHPGLDTSQGDAAASNDRPRRPRNIGEVRDHDEALLWAKSLNPDNRLDYLEARQGWGRFGSDVDSVLLAAFPNLLESASRVAQRQANIDRDASAQQTSDATGIAHPNTTAPRGEYPANPHDLIAYVDGLSVDQPGHRRAAWMLLGHSTAEVDHAVFARFEVDERVAARYAELHPDTAAAPRPETSDAAEATGVSNTAEVADIDDSAQRHLADDEEVRAARERSTPDDPATPAREDAAADAEAARHQQRADASAAQSRPRHAAPIPQAPRTRSR